MGRAARRRRSSRRAPTLLWLFFLASSLSAADLTLEFAPRWNGEPLPERMTNAAGQSLRITRFAAIISGVSLIRDDGGATRLDGQFGLIDLFNGRRVVVLRNVPSGKYLGLEFTLGLPPEVNHGDVGQWPAGHPLNPLVNDLHWGWRGGYVFAALEGRWRGAAGQDERGFLYHIAEDRHAMTVGFRAAFHIDRAATIAMATDLGRLLGSRRFDPADGSESTHSAKDDALADQLARELPRTFLFLEAREADAAVSPAGAPAGPLVAWGATPHPFKVPAGFPQPSLPADNPMTEEGIALGQALFADPRLSGPGTQACASCHQPERAMSDRVARSNGADGRPGVRNAMPLFNLAWSPAYAWEGGKPRIRDQVLAAMTNPVEMHAELATVLARLAADPAVRTRFAAAFGTGEVTAERLSRALEQYLLTIISADSRFDRALHGGPPLTKEEQRGFELFNMELDPARGQRGADCFHCHGGLLFTDFAYKNTGLERNSSDPGRAAVTGLAGDRGKFKTPSLRNVALTGPYMHDGRFATLEDVVAHYDHGVQRGANLDPNLAKHPDEGMKMSAVDQAAIVAFLKALTDLGYYRADAVRRGASPPK